MTQDDFNAVAFSGGLLGALAGGGTGLISGGLHDLPATSALLTGLGGALVGLVAGLLAGVAVAMEWGRRYDGAAKPDRDDDLE